MMRLFDSNRDGKIDVIEYVKTADEDEEQWKSGLFRLLDLNNDGFIDRDECLTVLITLHKKFDSVGEQTTLIENLMKKADIDGNGKIDSFEFGPNFHYFMFLIEKQ